ncbi:unnamed protein product [Mycena citricolor]|uniref:Uncharacterized protein n=1 Tax=Mycena citricolor TaxID=2018698 RepID=A0AAD2GYI8_9AGAR|nr:unnamed protein product [Mycena citricolor]
MIAPRIAVELILIFHTPIRPLFLSTIIWMSSKDSRPLPYGWISQEHNGNVFYVDTKATPPRSIWTHPLDDEQYLKEHPDAREKAKVDVYSPPPPPEYSSPPAPGSAASSSTNRVSGAKPEKRGFFGKIKDATVGTKEEREQEKRHKEEQRRQLMQLRERQHQEAMRQQAEMYQQQQLRYQQQPQWGGMPGPYPVQQQQRAGFGGGGLGGGGMALPLLGGLAGGMLLGDMMSGGFGEYILIYLTTRTTSLTSVPHKSFNLRFSDLEDIETATREDEDQRAERTLDWIGARISKRCSQWLQDIDKLEKEPSKTPWWDELRRCAEGDSVPIKQEGWNHPVAIILAVSTTAPNPLQAITALHARAIELPAWVDPIYIRYTLIVHPENSPFSEEEAGALFNAVKKQFGLHSYILPLSLPSPRPSPVPIPALMPSLPPPPTSESLQAASDPADPPSPTVPPINTLRMSEGDIQQTARFTREFVVMSLIPWMERCVVEWNETFSSNRRLPSRLFSSTRRLFGSPSPSPAPTHTSSGSISRSSPLNGASPLPSMTPSTTLPTHRRLAEFATILGDVKLAVTVWEALRKESKGGSDMLPMLLAPSPTLPLHAGNALTALMSSPEPTAQAQIRALIYAVRWETGIPSSEFLSDALEGDRWLVWAAGKSEEASSALLLGHAALLSARRSATRRAALWYLSAANRLEKCGIKPLTMYFLRKAQQLYQLRTPKELSPSFWDSEGRFPEEEAGFDAILPGIEHPLGRLLYTTGDVAGAVGLFLGLFRDSLPRITSEAEGAGTDKMFLDDFRVAFAHFQSTFPNHQALDLTMPFALCVKKRTRLRLARDTASESDHWQPFEDRWDAFWKSGGQSERLEKPSRVGVNEIFHVEVVLRNPLDTEVNLSSLTVLAEEASGSTEACLEIETSDDIVLAPKESRTVAISVKALRATTVTITDVAYTFLSLLPVREPLAMRGARLQNTPAQRQYPTYAPDVLLKVDVVEAAHQLRASFVDDLQLNLYHGETRPLRVLLENCGSKPIGQMWLLVGEEDAIWLESGSSGEISNVARSDNSVALPEPQAIAIGQSGLQPGDRVEVDLLLHANRSGEQELSLLFVFREDAGLSFHSAGLVRRFDVQPILDVSVTSIPCRNPQHLFSMDVQLSNVCTRPIQVTQVMTPSPGWRCDPLQETSLQVHSVKGLFYSCRIHFGVNRWEDGSGSAETFEFVKNGLRNVLLGTRAQSTAPPIDVLYTSPPLPAQRYFHECSRRNHTLRQIAANHPHIPSRSFPDVFPLYNPHCVDVIVHWEIPAQERSGHVFVPGVTLGAGHAPLREILQEAENTKVTRSMYAETQRERTEVVQAIERSEWNSEMNPHMLSIGQRLLSHDFSKGLSQVPIDLTVRNYSPSNHSRFVLRLKKERSAENPVPDYSGRVTFRGTLGPLEATTLTPRMWIDRPGSYSLDGWELDTEIVEVDNEVVRLRYQQTPQLGSLVVSDLRTS